MSQVPTLLWQKQIHETPLTVAEETGETCHLYTGNSVLASVRTMTAKEKSYTCHLATTWHDILARVVLCWGNMWNLPLEHCQLCIGLCKDYDFKRKDCEERGHCFAWRTSQGSTLLRKHVKPATCTLAIVYWPLWGLWLQKKSLITATWPLLCMTYQPGQFFD